MIWTPYDYQQFAVNHAIQNPYSGLLLDMGLGKTVIALTVIRWLMYYDFSIEKPLVIAPKKVLEETWDAEASKWDHLRKLRIVKIHGTQRQRLEALKRPGDIYMVSRDNIAWLADHYMSAWPFDMIAIDESSSIKNRDSNRFRAVRMVRPFCKRVIILTGTPIPNGLNDLWAQVYVLDQGKRLGKHITDYHRNFLFPEPTSSFHTRKYSATEENRNRIFERIKDICISMKSEDYLQLPEKIEIVNKVELPPDIRKRYKDFERTQVLKAWEEAGRDIAAVNAGALTMKLLQFANGAVYENDRVSWVECHREKIEALGEIVESLETQGENLIVAYQYKHDLIRLKKAFGGKELGPGDVDRWNRGEIPILYLQISQGIGLNLQAGGCHIAHFGMNYNLEHWLQFNKRIHRIGQTKPCYIHKLLTVGTMDIDVCRAIDSKNAGQEAMLEAVKARIQFYTND